MPIPAFDGILNVLPPHLGDPRQLQDLSPYPCTMVELCTRFARSDFRLQILEGFLNLRAELFGLGVQGFQWLGGSFLEDIETQENRDPRDIDVVTFVNLPADPNLLDATIRAVNPLLLLHDHVKNTYHVDHFWLPLGSRPIVIVSLTRYWYGLFSHRRDRVWKGMLAVDLQDKADDDNARNALGGIP